jgi:hypothetical protein
MSLIFRLHLGADLQHSDWKTSLDTDYYSECRPFVLCMLPADAALISSLQMVASVTGACESIQLSLLAGLY